METTTRYLMPAVLARPTTALVRRRTRPTTDEIGAPRLALALLHMVTSRDHARCERDAVTIAAAARATLPPLSLAAEAREVAEAGRIFDAAEALDAPDRVPVLLCVAYALHERTPDGPEWAAVGRALDAYCRAAERVEAQAARREKREPRRVLTEAHELAAAAIVEAVML
jgi:hypothetical protein